MSVDERVRGKFKVKKFRCFTCGSPHPALTFASSAFTTGVRDDEFR